jgi:hypothetical protein
MVMFLKFPECTHKLRSIELIAVVHVCVQLPQNVSLFQLLAVLTLDVFLRIYVVWSFTDSPKEAHKNLYYHLNSLLTLPFLLCLCHTIGLIVTAE